MSLNRLACPDCDLLQNVPRLPPRARARCRRCGRLLAIDRPRANERALALAIGAAIVFVLANVFPLMGLSVAGREVDTTIMGGAWIMWQEGQRMTAALVAVCAVIAPAAYIGLTIVVLLVSRWRRPAPAWVGELLLWSATAREWAMAEVMMLGILVALVKIADLATVIVGVGMFATGALILLITMIAVHFDPEGIWARTQWVGPAETTPVRDPRRGGS
ncbi:MAG: paraquat-inducible protein A [Pseudomonadota bacterium]|nr:paraquat-inducible protein A [Pseudomonadota bacterium]